MENLGSIVNLHTVRFERILPGPPERVWDLISTAEGMSMWHRCTADFVLEPQKRGRFSCTICPPPPGVEMPASAFAAMPAMPERGLISEVRGLVGEWVPSKILTYSFIDTKCDVVSEVRFELNQSGDDVILTFTHSHLPTDMMIQVAAGWHAHLDALTAALRGEQPEDFMVAFLDYVKKYTALVGASVIVAAAASPVMADSGDTARHVLVEQRARLLTKYDRIWKETDELKLQLTVLSHQTSENTKGAESDIERELKHKYDDLHQIEFDIRDLDRSLI